MTLKEFTIEEVKAQLERDKDRLILHWGKEEYDRRLELLKVYILDKKRYEKLTKTD